VDATVSHHQFHIFCGERSQGFRWRTVRIAHCDQVGARRYLDQPFAIAQSKDRSRPIRHHAVKALRRESAVPGRKLNLIQKVSASCERRITSERDGAETLQELARWHLAEEEPVRRRTDNERNASIPQDIGVLISQSKPMNENGAVIQDAETIKLIQFRAGMCVDAFAGMHNEGRILGGRFIRCAKIPAKSDRMRPSITLDDAHGKVHFLEVW
jgi:hypothetical protein